MSSIAVRLANLAEGLSPEGVIPAAKGGTGTTSGGGGGYINLSMLGTIVLPFTGVPRFYSPAAVTITTVYANISGAANGSLTFTIKKNGTSIGTTFTIPTGTVIMTPVVINVSLTTSDYLTLDVAGTATDAKDLYVRLKYL